MKAFSIDSENNITVYGSRPEALTAAGGDVFTSAAELGERVGSSGKRLVAIWNSLTGVTPVKKFMSAAAGAKRIFAELQKLDAPVAAAPAKAEKNPAEKKAKAPRVGRERNVSAKEPATGPRASSKNAKAIEMAKRPQGVTLAELEAFGWQRHTARSLMSAGGSITRKYSITFTSDNVDGVRTYFIR